VPGIGLAVAGLAGQLFSACLEGYSLLSAAKSFGRDYEDLCWKIDTERRYLEKWADAWISGESRIDPQSPDYRFAVTTLARISGVFAEMLEYSSKYGINYHRNERKRDAFRHLVSTSLETLSLSTQSNISTSSGLDQSSFELLTSPKLLKLDLIVPDLGDEVSRLKQSADTLQKTLPTKRKLQWSVVDKSKFEDLIVRLTEYNESLYKILPINPRSLTNDSSRKVQELKINLQKKLTLSPFHSKYHLSFHSVAILYLAVGMTSSTSYTLLSQNHQYPILEMKHRR